MKSRRIIPFFISCILIFSIMGGLFTADAAEPQTFTVTASVSSASSGDLVKISVNTVNPISKLGGIRLKVSYDTSLFQFQANSLKCLISDSQGQCAYSQNATAGTVTCMWDTTAIDTSVAGTLFTLNFVTLNTTSSKSGTFSLSILELFDSSNAAMEAAAGNTVVTSNPVSFTAEQLQAFQKLENITYPGSWDDVLAADKMFSSFSSNQIEAFIHNYAQLYSYYSTAYTRYYNLEAAAAEASIDTAVQAFIQKYARVFGLTADTVALSDKDDVNNAYNEYIALSSQVKSRLSQNNITLLSALKSKIQQLAKADADYQTALEDFNAFESNYSALWSLTEDDVKNGYAQSGSKISEALLVYDTLSPQAKEFTDEKGYKTLLNKLYAVVQQCLANDEEEKALQEQVSAFQKKWLYVISLSESTVTVYDESAINMMLSDLNSQSPELQGKLSLRKKLAEHLLEIISDMKTSESSGTVSTVEKVIYVTQSDDSDTSTNSGNANSSTTNNSSSTNSATTQSATSSKTQSASSTVTSTTSSAAAAVSSITLNNTPLVILILSIVLGVALLVLAFFVIRALNIIKFKSSGLDRGKE